MVRDLLIEFERHYPIRFDVVLAYLPKTGKDAPALPHSLFPEGIEKIPPRFAIDYRNRWMLSQSDLVVTYVRAPVGGAAKFKQLAERKKKTIIEL